MSYTYCPRLISTTATAFSSRASPRGLGLIHHNWILEQ